MGLIQLDCRADALDSRYSILLPVLSLASRIVIPTVLILAVKRRGKFAYNVEGRGVELPIVDSVLFSASPSEEWVAPVLGQMVACDLSVDLPTAMMVT